MAEKTSLQSDLLRYTRTFEKRGNKGFRRSKGGAEIILYFIQMIWGVMEKNT
jgi:hypothetical protein